MTTPRLTEIHTQLCLELQNAVVATRHPWHLPGLATIAAHGPEVRTVVLRAVADDAATLTIHTDARTPKIAQLRRDNRVSLLFHDANRQTQIVMRGEASLHSDDDIANEQWAQSAPSSQLAYMAPLAPGVVVEGPWTNRPQEFQGRLPAPAQLQSGRPNFMAIVCHIRQIDWLWLQPDGNLRARFDYETPQTPPTGQWLAP